MKTIHQLWTENDSAIGLKVRFKDWNYKHRYFVIQGFNSDRNRLVGTLDCGESISFALTSQNWIIYYEGAEFHAQAV